jgi:hypothetical protein
MVVKPVIDLPRIGSASDNFCLTGGRCLAVALWQHPLDDSLSDLYTPTTKGKGFAITETLKPPRTTAL